MPPVRSVSVPESPAPACPHCGYSLVGHSVSGECPECGSHFEVERLSEVAKRPPLGWLLLVVPPLVVAVSYPLLYFTLLLVGILFIPVVMLAAAVWSWHVSNRVAAWRHCERLKAVVSGDRSEPSPNFQRNLVAVLFGLQLLGILATWPVFIQFKSWAFPQGFAP